MQTTLPLEGKVESKPASRFIDVTPTNLAIANMYATIWRDAIAHTVMSEKNRARHTKIADAILSEFVRLAIVTDHCKTAHHRGKAK